MSCCLWVYGFVEFIYFITNCQEWPSVVPLQRYFLVNHSINEELTNSSRDILFIITHSRLLSLMALSCSWSEAKCSPLKSQLRKIGELENWGTIHLRWRSPKVENIAQFYNIGYPSRLFANFYRTQQNSWILSFG